MSLERERELLENWERYENTVDAPSAYVCQKKLVHALEQLEQAREALERISETETDWRQSLDANMEGVRTVACQALKQQEVGDVRI